MSLRIRIPAQKPSTSSTLEDMESLEPSKRKRKLPKRYQEADGEPVHKASRTFDKARRNNTAEHAPESVPEEPERDAGIHKSASENEEEHADDHHSDYSAHPSVASTRTTQKSKQKLSGGGAQSLRKKSRNAKVLLSESESDGEEYKAVTEDAIPEANNDDDDDDDGYLSSETKLVKTSKGKGKAHPARSGSGNKGVKRKPKADPEEVQSENKGSTSGAGKKRLKPSLRTEDIDIDVVGGSVGTPEASATIGHSSPATTKHESPVPAVIPKKPKLPTIKKTKLPGTPGLNTPTSAGGPPKKFPLEISGNKGLEERMKLNLRGQTDIDLSNKSVYQELFLKTGNVDGSIPRRAKEEERRKELNRMREEAKAKRAAEALHSFDLQAQFDKISTFEDKLRAERSSALYPNFLAAKWREKFERDRKRQKDWDDANYPNGREEGEVS